MKGLGTNHPDLPRTLRLLLFRLLSFSVYQIQRFQSDYGSCEMTPSDHEQRDLSLPVWVRLVERFIGWELNGSECG